MTSDNRFKPPEAALDSRASSGEFSRGPLIAIAVAGLLQLAWLASKLPIFFRLVSEGAMNPVGPFVCLAGCVWLYVGLLRALQKNGARGRDLFLVAVVLLLSGLMLLNAHRSFYGFLALMPFVVACVIAAIGLALTWTRSRARKEPA